MVLGELLPGGYLEPGGVMRYILVQTLNLEALDN
jgi:hypothetical protein